jgi:hypothetical protein
METYLLKFWVNEAMEITSNYTPQDVLLAAQTWIENKTPSVDKVKLFLRHRDEYSLKLPQHFLGKWELSENDFEIWDDHAEIEPHQYPNLIFTLASKMLTDLVWNETQTIKETYFEV